MADRSSILTPPLNRTDRPEFDRIASHAGHDVEVVLYGDVRATVNASIECLDCGEVITDEDRYPEEQR